MPNELKNLTLIELSLVDRPANPMAMAPIFKRDTSDGENMTDEVIKMSDEMDKKIKDYMERKGCDRKTAENAMMKSFDEVERLTKALIDNGFSVSKEGVEKKAPVETIDIDGEQVNKADIPAPVLKALEKAEKDRKEAAVEKAAKETLPNWNQDVAKALMQKGLEEDILEALKAADALFAQTMTEKGHADPTDDLSDYQKQLDDKVAKYAADHNVTKYKAYAEVAKTKDGKELINKLYEEDK